MRFISFSLFSSVFPINFLIAAAKKIINPNLTNQQNTLHKKLFIRYVLNKKKINLKKNNFLKKELLKPTKIYVKEVLKVINNNLINGCANITGGGIGDNIKRVIPNGLVANVDLTKIKTSKIFNWLKKNNIEDNEMLKTFNCGVGFCLIVKPQNLKKISKFFTSKYKPYVIGKITNNKKKIILNGKISWS